MRGEVGGMKQGRRKGIERQEGRSNEALRRMLCLAVSQPFSFHVLIVMFVFSSHQLCEVLTTTESGLPETQTNHRS